jgi:hypothetical protein
MADGNVVWLILRQLTIAIAAVVRDWAKAPVYFAVSVYPVPKAFGTGQLLILIMARSINTVF